MRRSHRNDRAGQDRHEDLAEALAVVVELRRARGTSSGCRPCGRTRSPCSMMPVIAITYFLPTRRPVELDRERRPASGPSRCPAFGGWRRRLWRCSNRRRPSSQLPSSSDATSGCGTRRNRTERACDQVHHLGFSCADLARLDRCHNENGAARISLSGSGRSTTMLHKENLRGRVQVGGAMHAS